MIKSNEFYYIYVVVGPPFIKVIINGFKFIPNDANVVIITNTPKILENVNPHFNLIIADLNSLRDEWSLENEKIINIDDEKQYLSEFMKFLKRGYAFPMQISRFGIKWAALNNITNFAVVESGHVMGVETNPNALNIIRKLGGTKNILFGNPIAGSFDSVEKRYLTDDTFGGVVKKYGVDLTKLPTSICYEWDANYAGSVGFEGGMVGLLFNDVSLVEKFFNLYSDLIMQGYKIRCMAPTTDNPYIWYTDFVWVFSVLTFIFSGYFNTIVMGHHDIIIHFHHPEEFFFMADIRFPGVKWTNTSTRKEFLIVNREELITFFQTYERAKELIYDFE